MMPKNKGGTLAALLFCLIMIGSFSGCSHYTIDTSGPQVSWRDMSVYIVHNWTFFTNNAQQGAYIWAGKLKDGVYVHQASASLGCHSATVASTDFKSGDEVRVMFRADGDSNVVYFQLGEMKEAGDLSRELGDKLLSDTLTAGRLDETLAQP